jgi:hypothetical protein
MENEMEVLNPDIKEVTVGVRKLRKIMIYPLSVVDQMKVTDLFQEALGAFLANKDAGDVQFVALFIAIIKTNLAKVLALVVDVEEDSEKLLTEITNNQLTVIANVLYEMNYALISKNVSGLLKKLPQTVKKELPLERPLQQSVKSMDTDSKIFSGNLGETED